MTTGILCSGGELLITYGSFQSVLFVFGGLKFHCNMSICAIFPYFSHLFKNFFEFFFFFFLSRKYTCSIFPNIPSALVLLVPPGISIAQILVFLTVIPLCFSLIFPISPALPVGF